MSEKLQALIIECGEHLDKASNVGLSDNQKDIYHIIDYLVTNVNETYPYAPCKDKCSNCCMTHGLPRVTAIEWQNVHKHLIKNFSKEQRFALIQRTKELYLSQLDQLMEEQDRIKQSYTEMNESVKKPKPGFTCLQCPFLVDNSCTVYSVRPAICRSYGFFTTRAGGVSKLFTCQMAADEIFLKLRTAGIKHWALPVWDKFSDRLYKLNGKNAVATLPLWIFSHLKEDGDLSEILNRNPDFSKVADSLKS